MVEKYKKYKNDQGKATLPQSGNVTLRSRNLAPSLMEARAAKETENGVTAISFSFVSYHSLSLLLSSPLLSSLDCILPESCEAGLAFVIAVAVRAAYCVNCVSSSFSSGLPPTRSDIGELFNGQVTGMFEI